MTRRIKTSALAVVLLGSGVFAVCGDRSAAAEPLTHEFTSLTGGWLARANFNSDGKLTSCIALRHRNEDGVSFGLFVRPEGWGVGLIRHSWQLEPGDRFVDVRFDRQPQRHLRAKTVDPHMLGIAMDGEELVNEFRKAYTISISFEGQHFDFSLAGTFRLLPVLTSCVQTYTGRGTPPDVAPVRRPAAEAPPAERPMLGVKLVAGDGAPRIDAVAGDSVAENAGLKVGDHVVWAAGLATRNPADLIEIISRQAPGTWLPLKVRRDGQEIDLIAKFPPRQRQDH